ncbi:MAG: class I SAM-dependent methyltransferase [Vicinamibacteria bacterium]
MSASKLGLLLGVLARDPREFADRVRAVLEVRADRWLGRPEAYPTQPWPDLLRGLGATLGVDAAGFDREVDESGIEARLAEGVTALGASPGIALRHNADTRIARLCYIACRALRPQTVVETGVAYGVTTTFVLTALERNGHGQLHSIDLPPLAHDADDLVGRLVPHSLRSRWTLHRGASRRVLPALLARLGTLDVFIHDSLHTSRNMAFEFELAHRHRASRFALLADDIEQNGAFAAYARQTRATLAFEATCAASTKDGRAGACVLLARA